jgi:predicted DNA-binding protein (MmcQ/YjbR family)
VLKARCIDGAAGVIRHDDIQQGFYDAKIAADHCRAKRDCHDEAADLTRAGRVMPKPARKKTARPSLGRSFSALRAKALSYPETREDHPWGETAIKVRGKTFIFMRGSADHLSLSVKLPASREFALERPFAKSTGYGLGRSGWVTSTFSKGDTPPMDVLLFWLDESYRAIAPKKLLLQLKA